jgi:hypothetical protein
MTDSCIGRKLQVSIPEGQWAIAKAIADARGTNIAAVLREYIGRALAEHANQELDVLWRVNN